jgi:hypothetical protein
MRTYPLLASVALGLLFIQPASAAPQQQGAPPQNFGAQRGGGAIPVAPNPVSPQFNDPGAQMTPVQPGNPVQQLSPLGNAGQPDSLGIQ